jgi:hypothetical protein
MSQKYFTQGQAIDYIEKVFGDGKPSNGGKNFSVVCPMCRQFKGSSYSKQKLVIRTDNFWVHCWVCGYKARNLYKLIQKYHPANLPEYKQSFVNAEELEAHDIEETPEEVVVQLPVGFRLLGELVRDFDSIRSPVTRRYAQQALDYLRRRNITSKSELWYWKLGITENREARCKYRIIIPSYDSNGDLSYWTARSWTRKPMFTYKNPPSDRRKVIFNELNIDWEEPLTIVEGPFDLLKANQNATAVLGSEELTLEFALLQKIVIHQTPVVLAFDPDPKAQKKQFRLAKRLAEFDVPVRILEYPSRDRDIGDMTRNEFMELLASARQFTENYELRMRITSLLK